jgi:hypothetical protein
MYFMPNVRELFWYYGFRINKDFSIDQNSVDIRKKMNIGCATAKLFTGSTQHSTALQPESFSE